MALQLGVSIPTLAKKTWHEFGQDNVARLGAALAYYTFTSFFPLMLVLISLIGIALTFNIGVAEDARSYVIEAVSDTLPAARDLLAESIRDTEQNSSTLGLVGLLTGLWAASNIFAQLEEAFNIIFDVVPRKRTWRQKLKARGQAALIVVLIAVLMIGSLVFSTVLSTVESLTASLPAGGTIFWLLNLLISLTLTSLVFAALFRYVPDKVVTWKAALIGGVFTSVTWQVGREVLTWWLGRAGGVTAGTVVGSVLAFLALVYYASQILMLGAQLTATYDELVHPDKVRDKTASDSPLRGPGRGVVNEAGEVVQGGGATSSRPSRRDSGPSDADSDYEPKTGLVGLGLVGVLSMLYVALRGVVGRIGNALQGRGG